MKRMTIVLSAMFLSVLTFGQTFEIGAGLGVSNFLGDLGKKQSKGRSYIGDVEASLFRPATTLYFRNTFNPFFAVKGAMTYGMWAGDDRLAKTERLHDDAWFRNYRNLHFRSHVVEFSATAEVNFMRYMPGNTKNWIAPYLFTGIAMVWFNPKAEYNGQWVPLRPLGTEGQGMPQYPDRKKYSLLQPSIPIGLGVKMVVSRLVTVGFEIGHRFTFTDYLDDVSTNYVSKQEFIDFYGSEKGTKVYELSRRSHEIDPEESYGSVTKPGEVRGNPGSKDSYLFSTFTIAYKLPNKFSEFSYSHKRNIVKHNPAKRKKINKYKRFIKNRTW